MVWCRVGDVEVGFGVEVFPSTTACGDGCREFYIRLGEIVHLLLCIWQVALRSADDEAHYAYRRR